MGTSIVKVLPPLSYFSMPSLGVSSVSSAVVSLPMSDDVSPVLPSDSLEPQDASAASIEVRSYREIVRLNIFFFFDIFHILYHSEAEKS